MANKQHLLQEIQVLFKKGELSRAEKKLLKLYKHNSGDGMVLKACFSFYFHQNKVEQAMVFGEALFLQNRGNQSFLLPLLDWKEKLGQFEDAIKLIGQHLRVCPDNLAIKLKLAEFCTKNKQYKKALNILSEFDATPEQLYIDVLKLIAKIQVEIRQEGDAIETLTRVLEQDQSDVQARFNLATLLQSAGRFSDAEIQFEGVLNQSPKITEAVVRLIYNSKVDLNSKHLSTALLIEKQDDLSQYDKEKVYYSLGKAFDDLKEYQKSFNYYFKANQLNLSRVGAYEGSRLETMGKSILASFSWNKDHVQETFDYSPVFIVGHFRSGSTLVEQIISGNSAVEPLGEVEYFLEAFSHSDESVNLLCKSTKTVEYHRKKYLALIDQMTKGKRIFTDKRPENILFMGLIKKVLPNAKFIVTSRNILDNAISIYFQQLNDLSSFATSFESFYSYNSLCQKLISVWKNCFGNDIFEVSYEKLIENPESESKALMAFLDIEWSQECLNFQNRSNFVRTASVSQVRKQIYKSSINRSKNYLPYLSSKIKRMYGVE